jgi:predicted deacetylase
VRENVGNTVPIVMYAKFAFGVGTASEIGACLIVDDPPLKPRYGFLRYQEAVRLMDAHNFATTVAFIPWNWRRTDSRTVQLFHERLDRLSLCIHGCDHTSKEFAERSTAVLNKRINVACQRMRRFGRRTQLRHDDVMLFPQGAFSTNAARALKLNGFVAAANTEVVPAHREESKTTVGDLFGLATMKYASFPMFTRRYLAHGVENFAFDGLLGKSCFIAAHHDDFEGDARILLQVIAKLNSLNWKLRWRSLGDAISRSFSTRRRSDGVKCVEMYGARLIYKNWQGSPHSTAFLKEESDFQCVKAVTVNGLPVDHSLHGGYLHFEAIVPPNESAELRIVYSGGENLPVSEDGINYRAKAVLRRYLSEFRDNYLSRNAHLRHGALRIREALRL